MSIIVPIILILFAGIIWVLWKKNTVPIRCVGIVIWVVVALLIYPNWNFARHREKVDPHFFEGRCSEAIVNAQEGLKSNYGQVGNSIVGMSYGFTPKYFFLSIIGICEYRQGKFDEAIKTLYLLLEYEKSNKYDIKYANKTQALLRKAISQKPLND